MYGKYFLCDCDMHHTYEGYMSELTEKDWQNLRMQLKTLVDIYCDLNDDVYKIKDLLKKIVKHLAMQKKEKKAQAKS